MVKTNENYGTMFACMSSRVVYIKASNSVSTDSFILALRKLVRERGNVRMIDTDNGTNFVAANMKRKGKESLKGNHSMRRIIPKSTGDKILLWQAIWEDFGSAKFVQLEIYSTYC